MSGSIRMVWVMLFVFHEPALVRRAGLHAYGAAPNDCDGSGNVDHGGRKRTGAVSAQNRWSL